MAASQSRPQSTLENIRFTPLPQGSESSTAATVTVSSTTATTTRTTARGSKTKAVTPYVTFRRCGVAVLGILVASVVGLSVAMGVEFGASDRGRGASTADRLNATASTPHANTSLLSSSPLPLHTTPTAEASSSSTSASNVTIYFSTTQSPSSSSSAPSSTPPTTTTTTTPPVPGTASPSTTTPPTAATFRPPCLEVEYTCQDGQCVDAAYLCDGIPHCRDGTDEGKPCACSAYQFSCHNGQCISQSSRCDRKADCLDHSDEMGCTDCHGFRCSSNDLCLPGKYLQCDGRFDCEDLSDEINCPMFRGYHRCDNGVMVRPKGLCNGVDDCGDNSDEKSCACEFHEVSCNKPDKGRCIPKSLLCDGFADCENGSDEMGCGQCRPGEFHCNDYSCVSQSSRCDGKRDCPNGGSDEDGCISVDDQHILRVEVGGIMFPVCADGWNRSHSASICDGQKLGVLHTWINSVFRVPVYAILTEDSSDEATLVDFTSSPTCKSRKVVRIGCKRADCGERKRPTLDSFIAGGDVSPLGKWPWVSSLAFLDKPICGAVILASRWVLTAAHCVLRPIPEEFNFTSTPFYFDVSAGATDLKPSHTAASSSTTTRTEPGLSNNKQKIQVYKIHLHPLTTVQRNGGFDWDMALLQLSSNLQFSDTARPICLPAGEGLWSGGGGEGLPRTAVCFVAGWGLLAYTQYQRPTKLRETRMNIWSEPSCKEDTVAGEKEVNINSTICAGFTYGTPTTCKGDSGSPLMCLDQASDRWSLAGVMSRGQSSCGRFKANALSNRFARVSTSVDWIRKTMDGH